MKTLIFYFSWKFHFILIEEETEEAFFGTDIKTKWKASVWKKFLNKLPDSFRIIEKIA